VLVLVDTSGSMVWHFANNNSCGGDGDLASLYTDINVANKNYNPGTLIKGVPDGTNSRLYAAKAALTNVVNATGDLDFGLMRYSPNGVGRGGCQNNRNCCNFATPGCVTNGDYIDNGGKLNWGGGCGTNDGNGHVLTGGQILVTPSATSNPLILPWVDGVEDFRDAGNGVDAKNPELRAAGSTPLAGSARSARTVRSGAAATRASNQSRSGKSNGSRRRPCGLGAVLPVARSSCDQRTALATLTEKVLAASRLLAPSRIAATTRCRKSGDRARVISCWPPSSQQLESEIQPRRNPSDDSVRWNQALRRNRRKP
jgi:hypothetical protein